MGTIVLNGATSGATTLVPTDAATVTLTLPGTTGTILSNAAPQSGGVIQVVSTTYATQISTTSGVFASTGISAVISPKFSTSKILALVDVTGIFTNGSSNGLGIALWKNGVLLQKMADTAGYFPGAYGDIGSESISYLDSPATTSATTYTVYWNRSIGGGTVYINNGGCGSSITLLEIAA